VIRKALAAYDALCANRGAVNRAVESLNRDAGSPAEADDPLDIAYLAIGAAEAWRANDGVDAFGDIGQDAVISEVVAFAANLRRAWAALGDEGWSGGAWYYEVSEPLGTWIVEQWIARGACPSSDDVDAKIAEMIAECCVEPSRGCGCEYGRGRAVARGAGAR